MNLWTKLNIFNLSYTLGLQTKKIIKSTILTIAESINLMRIKYDTSTIP